MDARHPESEIPVPVGASVDADRDRYWCLRCNAELDPGLGQQTLCLRCQDAETERPMKTTDPEPTLAAIYDAVMGVDSKVSAIRRQLDRLSALHVCRHPEDVHLFREDTTDAVAP